MNSSVVDKSVLCQYNHTMIIQKVYRNGNSLAMTIPQQFSQDLDLHEGSEIIVEKEEDILLIKTKRKALASDVDVHFMKMLDSFIKDHEDVLRNLKNK